MKKYLTAVWQNLASKKPMDIVWFIVMVSIYTICAIGMSKQEPQMNFWQIFFASFFIGVIFFFCIFLGFYLSLFLVNMFLDLVQGIADFLLLKRTKLWLKSKETQWNYFIDKCFVVS